MVIGMENRKYFFATNLIPFQVKWKRSVGLQFPFSKSSISWHKSLAWEVDEDDARNVKKKWGSPTSFWREHARKNT